MLRLWSPTRPNGRLRLFCPRIQRFHRHFLTPSSFQRLAPLEENHFWFGARNNLIVWALRKWFPEKGKLMEIGCGTGYVLSRIEKDFPGLELCGSEIYTTGLEFASKRLSRTELLQMDALNIPYEGEFDIIGLFDTLEHIQEDEAFWLRFIGHWFRATDLSSPCRNTVFCGVIWMNSAAIFGGMKEMNSWPKFKNRVSAYWRFPLLSSPDFPLLWLSGLLL